MANIKMENEAEKNLNLNEKPLAGNENLKQVLENIAEGKKVDNFEQARKNVISEINQSETNAPTIVINPAASIITPMAKRQKQIENILAKDLNEIYLNLTPEKRREFKIKGEQTAEKINQLLSKAKINIGEIIKLIKKWLSLIPKINKYFLEKEAKIIADELIQLKK